MSVKFRSFIYSTLLLFVSYSTSLAQVTVVDNQSAIALANSLVGDGITLLNPTLTCPGMSNGLFKVTGASNLGIDSGLVLTSGQAASNATVMGVNGPNGGGAGPSAANGGGNIEADLQSLVTQSIQDVCKLEFDFVPTGDTVSFKYVFGSSEYLGYSCSIYNDVFGFFISGPGIPPSTNIAVIPGSNVPITVNSTTGMLANPGPLCTNIAPGSPFSQYFVNNVNGATITYSGFTTVMTAKSAVNPCDTYHLKLAIADCSDPSLDSGVFLKAGSLNSNALSVKTIGGGGLAFPFTNTVRGCTPGVVKIGRSGDLTYPLSIPLIYAGTAVNGVDYATMPNVAVIPANDSFINLYIQGLPIPNPTGPKSVIIHIVTPYVCAANQQPQIIATDSIWIFDSLYAEILTPDTAICLGLATTIQTKIDSMLTFYWTPNQNISNVLDEHPVVSPTVPTTYYLNLGMKSGMIGNCKPSTKKIFVDVKEKPTINMPSDVYLCGGSIQLNAVTTPVNPDEEFTWTPATFLNNTTVRDPITTPTQDITYHVSVYPGAVGCNAEAEVKVHLLPDKINILNNDTAVCEGSVVILESDAFDGFDFNWSPSNLVDNPTSKITTMTATTSGYYYLTASHPNCTPMSDSVYVDVQPNPSVDLQGDKHICDYDDLQLWAGVTPNYNGYKYNWSFTNINQNGAIYDNDTSKKVWLEVVTPAGCKGSDSIFITVSPGNYLKSSTDTNICPPTSITLHADGADRYIWYPQSLFDNPNDQNAIAHPIAPTEFYVIGEKDYGNHICYDTLFVNVRVFPRAVLDLGDTITIFQGEEYQIIPNTNAAYFEWFPPSGVSNPNISDPIVNPLVRTKYFVNATTENGCTTVDTLDVMVRTDNVIELPNGFSPEVGNIFKIIKHGDATLVDFSIFNRWGSKVFQTKNFNEGWDGSFNGIGQPLGVYIWSVEVVLKDGSRKRLEGNVTLLR